MYRNLPGCECFSNSSPLNSALKTISNILDTDKEFRQVFNTFMSVAEVAILRNRTKEPVTFNKLKFTIKNESNEQSTS
jgi:hypothetical protein